MENLTDVEKSEFIKYYLEYEKALKENRKWKKDRDQHINHQKELEKYLAKDKIGNLTKDELIKLLKLLWANNIWSNIENRFIVSNNNNFEMVRDEIAKLLYGEGDIANRINNFYKKMHNFGISNLSEMLNFSFPDKYPLWNGPAIDHIKNIEFYNINYQYIKKSNLNKNNKSGIDYKNVIESITAIKNCIEDAENIKLDFIQMDSIISYIGNICKLKKNMNKNGDTKKEIGHIQFPHNIILHGPVGTGKTRLARFLASGIVDGKINTIEKVEQLVKGESDLEREYQNKPINEKQIKIVTFHQSYGYEDFIGGIKASTNKGNNNNITYNAEPGVFMRICNEARLDSNNNYVLIIDEINRGDISRIFGELITLIEEDKRENAENEMKVEIPNFDNLFSVPANVFIIGTMNDSDKSIALVDVALRRRFNFFDVLPNTKVIEKWIKNDELKTQVIDTFKEINNIIKNNKGIDSQIGHAFFKCLENIEQPEDQEKELIYIFNYKIFPLLKEIFYTEEDILNELLPKPSKFDEPDSKELTAENIESYLAKFKKSGDYGETKQ